MSTAFTALTAGGGTDIFKTSSIISEIVLAYLERQSISTRSEPLPNTVIANPASGMQYQRFDDSPTYNGDHGSYSPTDRNDWWHLINPPQSNPNDWVDHINGPLNGDGDGPLIFGDAPATPFYSAAGLNSSGFRRATAWDPDNDDWTDNTDAMFSYGSPQPGDIVGPWLVDDLQKAYSALKWTHQSTGLIDDTTGLVTVYLPLGYSTYGLTYTIDIYTTPLDPLLLDWTFLETVGPTTGSSVTSTESAPTPYDDYMSREIVKWNFTNSN